MVHGLDTMISKNRAVMDMQNGRRKAIVRDIMNVIIENSEENEAGKREWTINLNRLAEKIERMI